MDISDLPAVNASLNTVCTVLLLLGYRAIRVGDQDRHKTIMLSACVVSALFLASYLTYHFNVRSVPFPRDQYPTWAWVYFAILIPHIILAAVNVPLVIITLLHAFRGRLEQHKKIARITLFIWLYVSVTGVLVYLMLYQWFTSD